LAKRCFISALDRPCSCLRAAANVRCAGAMSVGPTFQARVCWEGRCLPDLAVSAICRFDNFLLDKRALTLCQIYADGHTTPVQIGSRALQVLCLLVDRCGEIVSQSEIMDAVWANVAVEQNNLTVQVSALRRVLDADRRQASSIQNIPGRGYRFLPMVTQEWSLLLNPAGETLPEDDRKASCPDEPVATSGDQPTILAPHSVEALTPAAIVERSSIKSWRGHTTLLAASCLCVAALLASATWYIGPTLLSHAGSGAPPRLSIVVLPFANLSGDPKEDYLADGITEDLTSDIAGIPGTFVIARQSAQTYRGKAADVRAVGAELGVRYVVEGSVRKIDDVLRVNAQLIATESGAHLWADRFDQPLKSLSAGQEAIVRRIGQSLNMAVVDTESARSKRERPTNPDAFDLILRARSIGLHPMGVQEHAQRTALYEQALRLDPTSLLAMMGVANSLILDLVNFGNTAGDGMLRAGKLISAAAAINPDHAEVLASAAWLLRAQDRYEESIAAYRHLVEMYPNYYSGYSQIGLLLTSTGHAEEGIPIMLEALRRDPQNPGNRARYDQLGLANLLIERNEEAIYWSRRALAAAPNIAPISRAQPYLRIAAAQARLGRLDEAHNAVVEANRAWPYDTVRTHWPADYGNPIYVAQIESFQAALRLAGHRDHADEDADFGVASDDSLPEDLGRPTPTSVPGATTIHTAQLHGLLTEHKPIIIDPMMYWWGRSLPGAIGLKRAGGGGSYSDAAQDRLRRKMQTLTNGDLATPIVAIGFNSERFDGRNLALRLVTLGYTNVYWYRGGREAWEVNGLPETAINMQEW
jgi:TolB-like protein/DNA-binding winged helix-turn-helix (wHTH) protein